MHSQPQQQSKSASSGANQSSSKQAHTSAKSGGNPSGKVLVRQTKVMNHDHNHSSPNPMQRLQGSYSTHQYNLHALQATQPSAASFLSSQQSMLQKKQALHSKTSTENFKDELRKSMSVNQAKVTLNLAKHTMQQKIPAILANQHQSQSNNTKSAMVLNQLVTSPTTIIAPGTTKAGDQQTACQGAAAALKKKMVKLRTSNTANDDVSRREANADEKNDSSHNHNELPQQEAVQVTNKHRLQHKRGSCKSQITASHLNEKEHLRDGKEMAAAKSKGKEINANDDQQFVVATEGDEDDDQVRKRTSLLASSAAIPLSSLDHQSESRMVQQSSVLSASAQTFQTQQDNKAIPNQLLEKGTGAATHFKKTSKGGSMIKISQDASSKPNLIPQKIASTKSVSSSAKHFKQLVHNTPAACAEKAAHQLQMLVNSPEGKTMGSSSTTQALIMDEKFMQNHRQTMQPRTSKGSKLNSPLRSPESFQLKTMVETQDNLTKTLLPPPASGSHSKKKTGSIKNGGSVVTTPAFKTGSKDLHQKRASVGAMATRQQQVGASPVRRSFEDFSNTLTHNQLQFQSTAGGKMHNNLVGLPTQAAQIITTTPQHTRHSGKGGSHQQNQATVTAFGNRKHSKNPLQHADLQAYTEMAGTKSQSAIRSRKNSQSASHGGGQQMAVITLASQAENLYLMHEKLAKLQSTNKASKADRGAHYQNEKQKKSKKAQLHESGQFSPTTSKLIKHFLSKQKTKEALIATLSGDQKSVPRKQSFLKEKKTADQGHHRKHPLHASTATQSQRSHKHGQRRQSVASNSKNKDSQQQPTSQMYRTVLPAGSNAKEVSGAASSQPSKKLMIGTRKNSSTKYSSHQQAQSVATSHKNSSTGGHQIMQIAHSGSSKKLLEKVKPPLQQKNNYMTTGTSSPRQSTKFVLRQSKKRDSQSSNVDAHSLDKRMALSQSVQQLPQGSSAASHQNTGSAAAPEQRRIMVKKIKQMSSKGDKDSQQNNELLRSIEKLHLHRSRKGPHAKSIQVSGSDSSSVIQTIVSINRHPYFVGETFSDNNANTEQPSTANMNNQQNHLTNSTKNDMMANSDTNALALTSDQTKTKRRISKQTSQTSKNGITSSSKKGQKNSKSANMIQDQVIISSPDQRVHNFEPYGHAPVSPIGQSLFDNLNSHCLTGNQTNLFSGRSSGEKLRDIVTKMQEEISSKPQTSKEALQQLEAMHGIIQNQEGLIKQFQKDVQRQEEVIQRYEKHIRQLEGSNKTGGAGQSSNQNNNLIENNNISGFTERDSSSLQNPSSHYNNLGFKRQGTEILSPQMKMLSPCESDRDGTVKYNLTEKSTPGKRQGKGARPVKGRDVDRSDMTGEKRDDDDERRYAVPDQLPFSSDKHLASSQPEESQSYQTLQAQRHGNNVLTERRLVLMEEKEHMRLKLRKKEKQEKFMKQKINKLMFFFFTLQNKGVPVNEIYEQEGIKAIRTDRFDEIMAQIGKENGDQQPNADGKKLQTDHNNQHQQQSAAEDEDQYSFYTEDSYELLKKNPDIKMQSYQRPKIVPSLNLQNLPEYVSSSDEEEDEGEEQAHQPPQTNQNTKEADEDDMLQQQRQSMSQKDYRQSLQYIENFYQKHQIQSEDVTNGSINNDPRENRDQNPFSTPDLIIAKKDDEEELKEQPDDCSIPIPQKGKKSKVTENPDQWNPLSTPQKGAPSEIESSSNQQQQQQQTLQVPLSRGLDRCPSVLNKLETGLEILDQVTGQGLAMKSNKDLSSLKDQHSERNNHSSFQLSSLLSPPSKKFGYQQSQSMINNKADKFSSSSHPYQTSQQHSNSKRQQRSLASQSQSQLESIDMILSHDPYTKESTVGGFAQQQQQSQPNNAQQH